ncbi:MAG: hypothetical protein Q4C04_04510 [Clostridia bacterium]|nr:hypothetical protein [Clostridia bacterium]
MKRYDQFEKQYIGGSDIATLIMAGFVEGQGLTLLPLEFMEDGSYKAYIVRGEAEIGEHYEKVAHFDHWLKIYDDEGLTLDLNGVIDVYRAGMRGCIIQIREM